MLRPQAGSPKQQFRQCSRSDAPQHYSTAYDMAVLSSQALRVPEIVRLACQQAVHLLAGGERSVSNINSFLWRYDGAVG